MTTRRDVIIGCCCTMGSNILANPIRSLLAVKGSDYSEPIAPFENPYITEGLVAHFDGQWSGQFGKSVEIGVVSRDAQFANLAEDGSYFNGTWRNGYSFNAMTWTGQRIIKEYSIQNPLGLQLTNSLGLSSTLFDKTYQATFKAPSEGNSPYQEYGFCRGSLFVFQHGYYSGTFTSRIGDTNYNVDYLADKIWGNVIGANGRNAIPLINVAATISGLTLTTYINGEKFYELDLSSYASSTTTSAPTFVIGGNGWGSAEHCSALLYNRALKAEEVWHNFKLDQERFGI